VLKEELGKGQMVSAFRILADERVVFQGTSIGRSLIAFLRGPDGHNVTASRLTLEVLDAKGPSAFRLISVPDPSNCVVNSSVGGCALVPDVDSKGHIVWAGYTPTIKDCCTACRKKRTCAVFTTSWQAFHKKGHRCTLMATIDSRSTAEGIMSGSPQATIPEISRRTWKGTSHANLAERFV